MMAAETNWKTIDRVILLLSHTRYIYPKRKYFINSTCLHWNAYSIEACNWFHVMSMTQRNWMRVSASRDSNISVVSISFGFFFALFAVDRYLMMWFIIQFKQSTSKRFAFWRLFQFIIQLYLSHSHSQHTVESTVCRIKSCHFVASTNPWQENLSRLIFAHMSKEKLSSNRNAFNQSHFGSIMFSFSMGLGPAEFQRLHRWIITILPLFFMMFPSCHFFSPFETAQIANIPTRKVFI